MNLGTGKECHIWLQWERVYLILYRPDVPEKEDVKGGVDDWWVHLAQP